MKKLLVHLHLYYHDQLDYMLEKLGNIKDCDWDFYVTTCQFTEEIIKKILAFKKDAQIIELENAGYDLYPFTHVLNLVDLKNYDYIIKIHTKNSRSSINPNDLGYKMKWRDMLVSSLVGSKAKFKENLEIFASNHQIGMIGCNGLLLDISQEAERNMPMTNLLLKRLSIPERKGQFIAGTMFMVRAELMQPIKDLNLKLEEFKEGITNSTGDAGSLAHALESILGAVILHQESLIAQVEPIIAENNLQGNYKKIDFEAIKYLYIMYSDLGVVSYDKKEYKKALGYFEEALKHFDTLYDSLITNPGASSGLIRGLEAHMLDVRKNVIEISHILGDIKIRNNDFDEALEYYKKILIFDSNNGFIYSKIGRCLQEMSAFASAISFLDKAISLNEKDYDAYRILGDIYNHNIKDQQKALEYYSKYVENETQNKEILATVYNTMGNIYESLGQYENIEKQIECFQTAIELDPKLKVAYRNLGIVYPRAGRGEDAIKCYQTLFQLGSTMDDYFDYACLNIKLKNFEEGWKHYEYRFSKENGPTIYPKTGKPKWKGQKIEEKTLLVQYEQGFGDSIQFFRYLEQIKPLTKKIIFRVQNELVDLLKTNADEKTIEVVGMSTPLEKLSFDYHIPLMSIMYLLKANVNNIPASEGYLKADEKKIKEYKKKFFDDDCLKIGISWRGAVSGNRRRNVPLGCFKPLTKLKNVKIYSFQKDSSTEELKRMLPNAEIVNIADSFNDFADTAAAMTNLDLFITGDNALFNLAGAMGQKTYLLLNKDSEWRWFLDEDATPWYNSVKIFKKQNENDKWDLLMQRVIEALAEKTLLKG